MYGNMQVRLVFIATLFCAASRPASAVPVLWTLANVSFTAGSGGGTATGSFVFDADTNTYSAIDIVTTAFGSLPASHFVATHPLASAVTMVFLTGTPSNLTGVRLLLLQPSSALSNAGGTRTLAASAAEGTCTNSVCNNATQDVRTLASGGSLVGTPVATSVPALPVPALSMGATVAVGFLLAGVALLAMRRRGSGFAA